MKPRDYKKEIDQVNLQIIVLMAKVFFVWFVLCAPVALYCALVDLPPQKSPPTYGRRLRVERAVSSRTGITKWRLQIAQKMRERRLLEIAAATVKAMR